MLFFNMTILELLNNCFNGNKDLSQLVFDFGISSLDKYQLENGIKEIFNDRKSRKLKYKSVFNDGDYDYLSFSSILDGKLFEFVIYERIRLHESTNESIYFNHLFVYTFEERNYMFSNVIIRKNLNKLTKNELIKWENARKDRFTTVHTIV